MLKVAAYRIAVAAAVAGCLALPLDARQNPKPLDAISYTMRFPAPETHIAEIEATVPTAGKPALDLMLPTWSPGFYGAGAYAKNVRDFSATTAGGDALPVSQPQDNHWQVTTNGAARILLHYKLLCQSTFVTGSWVGVDFAVINGPSTFITVNDVTAPNGARPRRPHEVHLLLPGVWPKSVSSLDPIPNAGPNDYRADNYDTFIDSPIVLGRLLLNDFDVPGTKLTLADFGDPGAWDGARVATQLQRIVDEHRRMLGGRLPFARYVFLNAFRGGNGGLEHLNSSLLSSSRNPTSPDASIRWLNYVSHEFFHAINVKRLRPVELGPFDYEHVPRTPSLWISEGLTTYYGDLAVARSGVGTPQDFLADMSGLIRNVQTSPGHLLQTLQDASIDVGRGGGSGVGGNRNQTVSYYDKGPLVGLILDAKIRRASNGKLSLDDVMRTEIKRYSGEHGFTPEEFEATAAEVAKLDLKAFFQSTLRTTDELDYQEVLDWFGLRFKPNDAGTPQGAWILEARPDVTPEQRTHLAALMAPSK
jgi:predicted metalloprotease with PDZ domain